MVELALVLPVLLLIMVGILKAGLLYNNYITLTDAVRVGARQLSLGRGLDDPCTPAAQRTIDAAASLTLTMDSNPAMTDLTNPANAGKVKITLLTPDSCGVNLNPPVIVGGVAQRYTSATMLQGDQATVQATYPCDLKIMGIDIYPGCTLKASATEAIE